MLLREFFISTKNRIAEGGNLAIGDIEANRIDSSKRAQVVPIIDRTLTAINTEFKNHNNGVALWMPSLLQSKKFLAGSSFHFFNRLEIADIDFARVKNTVGDIDTQVDQNMGDQVRNWLGSLAAGTQIGAAQFVGMDAKDPSQILTLWKFPDIVVTDNQGNETPIAIQIDLELKPFSKGAPTKWAAFSASSDWNDLSQGIKGVFHKFIIRALTSLTKQNFLLRKFGVQKTTEKPMTDNMISFAVKSKEGGGLRAKYQPVKDPATGQQEVKDGLPVFTELPTSGYEQDIEKIFTTIFGDKLPAAQLKSLEPKFWSFTGIVELMKDFLDPQEQAQVADGFIKVVFGKGAQRLYKDSLEQDMKEKNAAVNKMYEILGIEPSTQLASMIQDYAAGFKGKPEPTTEDTEPAVAASPRKGVVHLEKMKSLDFLDLLDQLKDEAGGKFRLNNVKMTVKIDGMGGRFGKDANGNPFYESSSSGPIQKSGAFSAFAQGKGFTDPVQIDRAKKYDNLYEQIIQLIPQIDKKFGPDFLKDVKVHCEFLYTPMASEEDGKLKFVSVAYDQLPQGVTLALVPLFVEVASTGQSHPDNDKIKEQLISLGKVGDTMFIDNKLLHQGEMDVTGIIQPLNNIDELRSMLTSKKRDQIKQADAAIQPIKDSLAKEIISNPNILGKDKLGQDYEGIILYTNKGPIKVTSPYFKNIMAQKALAKQAQPTNENIERTGKSDTAVIGWGRGMGHKGHMMLASSVITHAKEIGGDPYFVVSRTFGPDDPLKPEEKLAIYRKVFPDQSHIFQTATDEIPDLTKVLRHLNQQGYRNATVIVGADQRSAFQYLTNYNNKPNKAGNIPYSFDELKVISRQETSDPSKDQEGPRATPMRQALLDPTKSDEEQFAVWRDAMSPEVSDDEVRDLMAKAKDRMMTLKPAAKKAPVKKKEPEPVAEANDDLASLLKLSGITNKITKENISITGTEKAKLMRQHNIKPGTEEWFKLWFSRPFMTGEKPVGD